MSCDLDVFCRWHLIGFSFVLVSFDVEVFVDTFDLDVFSVCLI